MARRRRQPVDANGDPIESELERDFETRWRQLGGPELVKQYYFDPVRNWRFDFAHIYARIAIEIDGGTWGVINPNTGKRVPGGHTSGVGYRNGCIKGNAAQLRGWFVFRLTSDMLRDDPAQHLQPIIDKINDLMDEGEDGPA
ncbi:MAG: hypothetical protein IPM41_06455 [Sphingomonadales bacterium]|nr:hypothetical protein [Sphingomonadales bacterium]